MPHCEMPPHVSSAYHITQMCSICFQYLTTVLANLNINLLSPIFLMVTRKGTLCAAYLILNKLLVLESSVRCIHSWALWEASCLAAILEETLHAILK